jgi:hypothetical protein
MPKTWFVSYRRKSRHPRSGHARMTETFETEGEARAFARNSGTINPHLPEKFFGSAKINDWLAEEWDAD